ncbi:MAG: HTTM domain-containing protein, partial [Thermoguttaceae bacterium]
VGFHTRLATIVSWVLLCSLQTRMPLGLNGGDLVLRLLLFWGMFLPLGQVWSLDAKHRPPVRNDRPIVSMASMAILVQVCLVYWFAGWAKHCNEAWLRGDALAMYFSLDMFARPLGHFLLGFPLLLKWASIGTVWLELIGPFVLFIPWRTSQIRLAMMAVFVGLHLGIEATLHVSQFSYVMLTAWCLFLPELVWSNSLSQSIAARLAAWMPSRSPPGKAVELGDEPGGLATAIGRAMRETLCAAMLLLAVAWNCSALLDDNRGQALRQRLLPVASTTMLFQEWRLFNHPFPDDVWFVYRARLSNGRLANLLRGGAPVSYAKPADSTEIYRTDRWRKMHADLLSPPNRRYLWCVAEYLCRAWNQSHGPDEQIVTLNVYCVCEPIRPGQPKQPSRRYLYVWLRPKSQDNGSAGTALAQASLGR